MVSFVRRSLSAVFLLLFATGFAASQSSNPVVSGISAVGREGAVYVSWELPARALDRVSALLLYRTLRPVTRFEDLERSSPLATLYRLSTSYTDAVDDAREYYYTVISMVSERDAAPDLYYDEELDGPGDAPAGEVLELALPGVNATVAGAKADSRRQLADEYVIPDAAVGHAAPSGGMRRTPLPMIDILGDTKVEPKGTISEESRKAASALLGDAAKPAVLPPHVFDEDAAEPESGDGYLLFQILKASFVTRDYERAIDEITAFLSQNRSEDATHRAAFYLGESYYYTGRFQEAVMQFLSVKDEWPALCDRWIESAVDNFEMPGGIL